MRDELRSIAVSSTVTACGGEGAGLVLRLKVKPAPAKQESNRMVSLKQYQVALRKFGGTVTRSETSLRPTTLPDSRTRDSVAAIRLTTP